MRTVLQVPLPQPLKVDALNSAREMGFSSLQEAVRVFLHKLAKKQITLNFQEVSQLSPANDKRYLKMEEDFKQDNNVFEAHTVNELMSQLNEN